MQSLPEKDLSIIVLSNSTPLDNKTVAPVADDVFAAMYPELPKKFKPKAVAKSFGPPEAAARRLFTEY